MSKNNITGDEIKSKVSTKEYEDNWERIFRKVKVVGIGTATTKLAQCPNYPEPCFCTGACKDGWDEGRIDAIGQNGNEGLHYDIYEKIEHDYNEGN